MAVKFYTAEKEIGEVKYKAQFNGIGAALDAVDSTYIDGTSVTSLEKFSKYILDNVIVEPKLSLNDFGREKIGEEIRETINGVEYVAKFNGITEALRAIDSTYIDGTDTTSVKKLSEYLFENVIIEPKKLSFDEFESMDEYNKVVAFARDAMQGGETMTEFNKVIGFGREVMQGTFRNTTEQKTARAKG